MFVRAAHVRIWVSKRGRDLSFVRRRSDVECSVWRAKRQKTNATKDCKREFMKRGKAEMYHNAEIHGNRSAIENPVQKKETSEMVYRVKFVNAIK